MTKLRINVTKEILFKTRMCAGVFTYVENTKEEGIGANCAISVAIRDLFPDAWVGTDRIYFDAYNDQGMFDWGKENQLITSALPEIARNFIREFDRKTPEERMAMNPLSFEIEIPDIVIDTINIDEVKALLTNHPTMELV